MGLGPVVGGVQLPDVVVEGRHLGRLPRDAVPGDRGPALVVDAAVDEHLEVLRLAVLGSGGVVEGRDHAPSVQRHLLHAVDERRRRQAGRVEHRRRHVDHVAELRAHLAASGEAVGPVHDGAVACAAPVRGHLLGPLVGRVHRVRPADRVVVVGLGGAELVDSLGHELGRLDPCRAVESDHLVERALRSSLGRGAVVADDVVDQRVVEDLEVRERVDQAADVMVGVLHEARVDLHLAREHRLEVVRHVVPRRDLLRPVGQLRLGRDHAELLLPRERLLAQRVPALRRSGPCTCPTTRSARGAARAWRPGAK